MINDFDSVRRELNSDQKVPVLSLVLFVFSCFVLLVAIIGLFWSMNKVDAGQVKVVKRVGRVTGNILDPGFHFIVPFIDSTVKYNTKKLTYETSTAESQKDTEADYKDYPVDTNTSDGQQVDVFYTIRFSVDPTKASWVAQSIGSEKSLVEKIVKTESRVTMRNTPREFKAGDLYTGNILEVQELAFERMKPVFEANGLILDSVGIREIKFTEQYIAAIEQKEIARVAIETAKNRADAAEEDKRKTITEAQAQSESQKLLQSSLSKEVLQNKFYETWDGKLPSTLVGGETSTLLQLPK